MTKILFIGLVSGVSLVALFHPWVGVIAAYFVAILAPQFVWWWAFDGIRPAVLVIAPTCLGVLLALVRGAARLGPLANRQSVFFLLLWFAVVLSYFAGSYIGEGPVRPELSPIYIVSTISKILILYFAGCICISSESRLVMLSSVLVISAAYLIFWSNNMYLSGQVWGRLGGPRNLQGVGIYGDENNFAMLFVTALPFFWYLAFHFRSRVIRWGLWLLIPLGWHAVFLTGSRGGLLALAASTLVLAWRSKSKILGASMIAALVVAFVWQGGPVMRERAATIADYESESSAAARLQAWTAAKEMIIDNPVTGVGVGMFIAAFPDYSLEKPRAAHNTTLQFAAESGVLAGAMYVSILIAAIVYLWRNGNAIRANVIRENNLVFLINEATLVALCGFAVCSVFLTLQLFEVFYYLCLAANGVRYLSSKKRERGVREFSPLMEQS